MAALHSVRVWFKVGKYKVGLKLAIGPGYFLCLLNDYTIETRKLFTDVR